MNSTSPKFLLLCTLFLANLATIALADVADPLGDKTLVVWAAPDNLDQRGGSALTIEEPGALFDGVVFGEIEPRRWMPGSNGFSRTNRDQATWTAETASPDQFVQVAIVYQDKQVRVYRNGQLYAEYAMAGNPQAFSEKATVLFGRRHLDVKDTFTGRIRDARIYDKPLDEKTVAALQPGKTSDDLKPWAWWSFADEGTRERTGRFTDTKLVGDVRIENGCLVLAKPGAAVIATRSNDGGKPAEIPATWSADSPVPPEVVRSTRLFRERLLADPNRPRYHFCTPEDMGVPGDPNGAFYADGRYHLMYLYNRTGSGFCWGHISSTDLVHWRHHPDAIGPGDGDEGCFSGGAFVDDDGTACLSYWMLWGDKGIGLASSHDRLFDHWTKLRANPVIKSTEWGVTETKDEAGKTIFLGSADPSNIWKKDGRYYILTGNLLVLNKIGRKPDAPIEEQGDRLYLFTSDDLKTWKYLHVFYQRKPEWTDRSEDNMCPSFMPLPSSPDGGAPSGKHLLLFIAHNRGAQYYIGDYRADRFYPESHGRMSWVDNAYFAPEALIDGRGRQIMWSWLLDNPPGEEKNGWSGVYGLPRTLWLGEDGTLRMRPVPELEILRCHEQTWDDTTLADGQSKPLDVIAGDSCELAAQIDPGTAKRVGLKVRASADGSEQTLLYYDAEAKQLVADTSRSGNAGVRAIERAPFELKPGEPLSLRVFVDKCIVEVFANDRQAIGRRVYPASSSLGVSIFTEGGQATFESLKAWEMSPSNPY